MKNSKTVIHTIRHGETTYNAEKRYAGTIDVPLNTRGIEDAISAARQMREIPYDIVVTSTLRRSMQTARYLCCEGSTTVQSALCNERNYGKMQGLTEEEVKHIEPKIEYIYAGDDYHSLNPPGGESFDELRRRALAFYGYLLENYRSKNVLVVSHGTFLQQFHGVLRGKDWLESLQASVRNLDCNTFYLGDEGLLNEQSIVLAGRMQNHW
jgi:2,3-bisphosphoglycerate-dependent phosphoglycerate mutase